MGRLHVAAQEAADRANQRRWGDELTPTLRGVHLQLREGRGGAGGSGVSGKWRFQGGGVGEVGRNKRHRGQGLCISHDPLHSSPLSHTHIRSDPPPAPRRRGRRLSFTCSDLIQMKRFSTKDGLVRPTWLAPPPHATLHTHTVLFRLRQNSMTVLKSHPKDIAPPLYQEWRERNTSASFFQALDV